MKKFTYNCLYRGQQITKVVCAKNVKEASEKLNINTYNVTKYCNVIKTDNSFEGVIAYIDSGMLWRKRKDLSRIEMPFDELKAIIDTYKDEE
jgi:hypothetical protein